MEQSRRSQVGRSLPTSIFQKFQGIYNQQEVQLKQNDNVRKKLLAKIMQREQQQAFNKKVVEKRLDNLENQEVDIFWKNEEERLRAMERNRRQQKEEARRVNNGEYRNLLSKSMEVDAYHLQKGFKEDLGEHFQSERRKREGVKDFYNQGMMAEAARQDKKRYDRELDMMIAQKKTKEDVELHARKQDFYANWRNKHFQEKHPQVKQMVAQINYNREMQKHELEEMIAVKGGEDHNRRIAAVRMVEAQQKQADRQNHLRTLKGQTQENTYKAAIDKYLQLNYQRQKMTQAGKLMEERDLYQKGMKKQLYNDHLKVLRNQFRPRVLQQQPDRIEAAGIGSPAHIGKIVHDDRIKQLKYIERSYMQELNSV